MIRIEFDLEAITKAGAEDLVLMLNRKFGIGATASVRVASTETLRPLEPSAGLTPAAVNEVGGELLTGEAQPETKRRGRPKKESTAAEPAPENPTPAPSGAAADAAPSPELPSQPAPAGEAKALTIDELRAGLQKFTVKHGMVKGKELLDSFGCARVTELVEKGAEAHAQFMAKCNA